MADLPTWLDLSDRFRSLDSIDSLRLDWSLSTPTDEGAKAGGIVRENWRIAQGTAHQRRDFKALARIAGAKLILQGRPNLAGSIAAYSAEFWYQMIGDPPGGLSDYRIGCGLSGEVTLENIQSATLDDAARVSATKCLEFSMVSADSLKADLGLVLPGAVADAIDDRSPWERMGGPKPSSWGEVAIGYSSQDLMAIQVEVQATSLRVKMSDVGLMRRNSKKPAHSALAKYFGQVMFDQIGMLKEAGGSTPKKQQQRQRVCVKLCEFFGLAEKPFDPLHLPKFSKRNLDTVRHCKAVKP